MKTAKKLFLVCFIFLTLFCCCTIFTQNTIYASNKAKLSSAKITITKGNTKVLKIKNLKRNAKWKIISGSKSISLKKKKSHSIIIAAKKKGTAKIQATIGKKHLICKIVVKNSSTKLCTTQLAETVACPQFHFRYPSNWKITRDMPNQGPIAERIVLKNSRGVTVIYMEYSNLNGLENSGRFMDQIKATKVADANFIPGQLSASSVDYSKLGRFIIAELKTVGTLYMDQDSDFKKINGGIAYALVPKSYLGLHEVVGDGFYSEFSFRYAGLYSFTAQAPKGKFTLKEKKQVFNILKSFNF